MANVKAVLFDLGDTLWHFPEMPPAKVIRGETVARLRRLVEGWGYEFNEGRFYLGRDIRLAIEEATHEAFHGDGIDPGYPQICHRIAKEHEMDISVEQSEELWETWNLGGAFLGRKLFPDALDTLKWLRDGGYRIACVTNRGYSGPRFHEELRDLGLDELFEETVVSCDVGYMKPHPKIYQHTLNAMGLQASEAAMVGDSLHADVAGSKALGMIGIWRKPPTDEPVEETEDEPDEDEIRAAPDYTITQLGDLKTLPIFSNDAAGK